MKAISVDPSVMHGTACFAGTRVPIEYVFSYLPNRVGEFLGNSDRDASAGGRAPARDCRRTRCE
jgi:hypothetical protein